MRDCDVDISIPQLSFHSERNKERKVFLGEVEQRGCSEMEKLGEKGDIDLNQVFTDDGKDLNRLFPDPSLKRFLKEIEENKREVRTFLEALEVEDEGNG